MLNRRLPSKLTSLLLSFSLMVSLLSPAKAASVDYYTLTYDETNELTARLNEEQVCADEKPEVSIEPTDETTMNRKKKQIKSLLQLINYSNK